MEFIRSLNQKGAISEREKLMKEENLNIYWKMLGVMLVTEKLPNFETYSFL